MRLESRERWATYTVAQLTWTLVGFCTSVEAEPSLEVVTDAEFNTSGAAQVAAEVGLVRVTVALALASKSPRLHGDPPAFPTRRSSDLAVQDRPALVGRVSLTVTLWVTPVPELVAVMV